MLLFRFLRKKGEGMKARILSLMGDTDYPIFATVMALMLCILAAVSINPAGVSGALSFFQNVITVNFTWFIMLLVGVNFFFAMWIALSKHGKIILGKEGDKPEFSYISWVSMLFSAGVGIGFVCFGVAEPMWHLYTSTHTANMGATGAAEGVPMAIQITVSNWGASCWALFAVGGMAIALPSYRKNLPMCVGTGLFGILGKKCTTSPIAKAADTLGIIGAICGNSAALGMGVMSISTAMLRIFGIEIGTFGQFSIMATIIVAFIISSVSGLQRGVRILSVGNLVIAAGLLIFVLFAGPTTYLLNMVTEVTGMYVSQFVNMNFFTDAGHLQQGDWLRWWPVFYWLWWISYIPFVGGFIARISKGRSLREFVVGVTLATTVVSILWFTIMGGAGAWAELVDNLPIWTTMQAQGSEPAVYMLLESYPLGNIAATLALISLLVFTVTTSDSASFFISMQVSKGNRNPTAAARILWGLVLGMLGVAVMAVGGAEAMNALKSLAVAGSAPFCIIQVMLIISLYKMLKMIDRGEM